MSLMRGGRSEGTDVVSGFLTAGALAKAVSRTFSVMNGGSVVMNDSPCARPS
jgi:hypothetical protein